MIVSTISAIASCLSHLFSPSAPTALSQSTDPGGGGGGGCAGHLRHYSTSLVEIYHQVERFGARKWHSHQRLCPNRPAWFGGPVAEAISADFSQRGLESFGNALTTRPDFIVRRAHHPVPRPALARNHRPPPAKPKTTNSVVLPIRPITSVSTVAPVDATGKEPQRRPSRRDSDLRSLAELPTALKRRAVRR